MHALYLDLRFALHSLWRGGGAIFVALATLVVAMASATAIFTLAQAVLFAPMPAVVADEVVWLARWSKEIPQQQMPVPTYFAWKERNRTLGSLGAYSDPIGFNLEGLPPERLHGTAVSGGFFSTLGIAASLGSVFGEVADEPGAPPSVVISQRLWLRRFGGDAEVIGRSLVLDGFPWEIVGVMPGDFHYPQDDIDIWLTMGTLHSALQWENRSMASLYAVGRRQEGVSNEQVRLDLERVTETIAEDTGVGQQPRPLVMPLDEQILGNIRSSLAVLGGAVFFVVLIACANVANLLLARGFGRGEEVAVRMALGAQRHQIIRLMLVESVTLSCSAGLLAMVLAGPLARWILHWIPNAGVTAEDLGPTAGALFFAMLLALMSGLGIGLLPAIRHSRQMPARSLRQGRRAVAAGSRLQSVMVVAEVAVATALLVAAGLMLRTLDQLVHVDLGFDARGVLVQSLAPSPHRYGGPEDWLNLNRRLLEETAALSTVKMSAVSLTLPMANPRVVRIARPGQALRPDVLPLCVNSTVSESYFDLLGIPLIRGRGFAGTDDLDHPLVAIVDESLAAAFWPGEDPIGQQIALEYQFPAGGYREGATVEALWREVVGVVSSARLEDLRGAPRFQAYLPLAQPPLDLRGGAPDVYLLSRTHGDPLDSASAQQATVAKLDPTLPIYGARTLQSVIEDQMIQERLLSTLLSAFALLALLLAAAGVYASMSNLVAKRTREMGLRLALGADPARVLREVTWRGLRLALLGALLGVAASVLLTRVLEGNLYGISRLDPVTFLAMPAVLLVAACLACLLPAWRAARVDPAECLRYE